MESPGMRIEGKRRRKRRSCLVRAELMGSGKRGVAGSGGWILSGRGELLWALGEEGLIPAHLKASLKMEQNLVISH